MANNDAVAATGWMDEQDLAAIMDHVPSYGDLSKLNREGIILKAVGSDLLRSIVSDFMMLMGTSSAVYEKNGDYALGIFVSGWCQRMNQASFDLCKTSDPAEAIRSCRWLCHESCWTDCSRICIAENREVDVECHGGLRIFAVPVVAGGEVVGAVIFGYGMPPRQGEGLEEIADKYQLDPAVLAELGPSLQSRPREMVELARRRLRSSALLIGKIVESHLNEQKYQQNEELMRHIIKYDPNAIAVFDHEMRYIACSDRFLQDNHIEGQDLAGKHFYDVFPEMPAKWRDIHLQALQGKILKNDDDWFEQPDGSIRHIRWECRPWHIHNGQIGGVIVYIVDITESRLAEKALRTAKEEAEQERALMNAIINSMDDGVLVFSNEGQVIFLNKADEYIYSGNGTDKPLMDLNQFRDMFVVCDLQGRELPFEETPIFKVMNGSSIRDAEIRARNTATGKEWVFSVSGMPLCNAEGQQTRSMIFTRDLTAEKMREEKGRVIQKHMEQMQRLESLGVLAGGIAHDFNNLLMAIIGHADLALIEVPARSAAVADIKAIKTSSRRAADLCNQLLAYSGKGKIEETTFSMSEVVEEMVHMLKTCISKNCVLNLHLGKQLPSASGDPSQMRQIIMNFVLNASDAIGDRSGVITVSTGAAEFSREYLEAGYVLQPEKPGLYVWLEVSDTGMGMDRKTLERIFEPFFTTKFAGRGLGLSAVLGIIRSHGGGLRVYSEPGKGTTFKVLLPAEGILSAKGAAAEGEISARTWRGKGTVLLVDDEETVRAISGRQLKLLGLDTLFAEDGREAVEMYRTRSHEIDLVILDLTMPKMNGEQAFRELRTINPEVRVIMASGYSETDVVPRFAGKNIAGYLRKPYSMDQLCKILSTLVPASTE